MTPGREDEGGPARDVSRDDDSVGDDSAGDDQSRCGSSGDGSAGDDQDRNRSRTTGPAGPTGPFRVLPGRDGDEWLLLDVESADPTYVDREALPDVEPGNRVVADLSWDGDDPVVADASVDSGTVFTFVRTDEAVFEAAETTFEEARAEGAAMNSRVTYSTDNDPNGVLYTFADQPGSRDIYAEFRDGGTPLEPLLSRAAQPDEVSPPFSVWVLDPTEAFVLVYIVLDPNGLLEETMRETYT